MGSRGFALSVAYGALALFCVAVFPAPVAANEEFEPLPVKLDSPRDTMATFLKAMNRYRQGKATGNKVLLDEIDTAVATLDLRDTSPVLQDEVGRETAIFLKEVIDRVIVVDFEKIPTELPKESPTWRMKNSDIAIARIDEGDDVGRYKFTKQTVRNARRYYERIKARPYLAGTGQGALYEAPWLERRVPSWLRTTLVLIPNWKWLGLLGAALAGLLVKLLGQSIARRWHIAERPVGWIAFSAFLHFAVRLLAIDGALALALLVLIQILFSGACVWLAYRLVDVFVERIRDRAALSGNTLDRHVVALIRKTLQVVVLVIGVLVVFQNLGINVVSLMAGLGLGGLAFALAAQDTCKNFFGSLMILFDRTYKTGDVVRIGQFNGTVEEVGFRSTRLRSVENTLVSIPNSTVANENVDNFSRRAIWRVALNLGLTYDTSAEKLRAFVSDAARLLRASPKVRQDTVTVHFSDFKADSLDVYVECFLNVADIAEYRKEREAILFEFLGLAEAVGVEFAFPTRTVHVATLPKGSSQEG